jgi:hypothetical protein
MSEVLPPPPQDISFSNLALFLEMASRLGANYAGLIIIVVVVIVVVVS